MKRTIQVLSVAWLVGAMLGCGGGNAEIKPKTDANQLTEEQKVKRDEEIQKSMQRSGYAGKPGMQPGAQPGSQPPAQPAK